MNKINIIDLPVLWVSVKDIQRLFTLKPTHTRKLINEMRESKQWRGSVVCYDRVLRINLQDFETFWKKKSVVKEVV